ncbi:Hypothetical protein D9617_4g002330 [Elsinoe fawcettii]|nr:Hypothetical protein D9617_4g002330 [Elsinoe fawcettii]
MPVLPRDDRDMLSIPPTVLVIIVMAGGGFLVLMCAAFHRFLGARDERDAQSRTPEQDGYMREVRQRSYNDLAYGRRVGRDQVDTSLGQDSGRY